MIGAIHVVNPSIVRGVMHEVQQVSSVTLMYKISTEHYKSEMNSKIAVLPVTSTATARKKFADLAFQNRPMKP